jgi:hypothetical protein
LLDSRMFSRRSLRNVTEAGARVPFGHFLEILRRSVDSCRARAFSDRVPRAQNPRRPRGVAVEYG